MGPRGARRTRCLGETLLLLLLLLRSGVILCIISGIRLIATVSGIRVCLPISSVWIVLLRLCIVVRCRGSSSEGCGCNLWRR